MSKDLTIPHAEIRDPATITQRQERAFTEAGLDMSRHEVERIDDDHDRGVRRLKVKGPRHFFDMGRSRR